MRLRTLSAAVGILAALAACFSQAPRSNAAESPLIGARDKLVADLRQCTQAHGYDPANAAGVAEHALAPQELPWRQCAYDAVRVYEQSNPPLRGMYEQLIAEDISMTTAIQQGTMTRSQRRARIESLVAQIKTAEQEEVNAATVEQSRQNEQLRNVVEGVRGFGF
jgi:hypothetical protein